jgi:outer membrane protein assembly factor BamB
VIVQFVLKQLRTDGSQNRFACLVVALLVLVASTAHAKTAAFADIEGWWRAQPEYGGDSAPVVLQFTERDGKPTLRLSLPSIGGFDMAAGNVTVDGNRVTTDALEFPLEYDAATDTLTGRLPKEIVPVHEIIAKFVRVEPIVKPPPRTWNLPAAEVKWRVSVNAPVWAGLAHDAKSGLLFVATDEGTVHAIDSSGKTRWTFDTGQAIKARPAVIAGSVFVNSDSGYASKLDADTGKEQWRAKIDAGSPPRIAVTDPKTRWDRYGSSFVSDGERVFVGSRDNHVYALDQSSGKEQWRVATGDMLTATPALSGDKVVIASFDGTIRALNRGNGEQVWSYDARLPISGDVAISGNRVLAGSRTYDLLALDLDSGKKVWSHYYWFSWIESPPMVRENTVYTGSSDATGIFALDLSTGARRWRADVPGFAWPRVALDDRMVVAGTVGNGPYPGNRAGALVGLDRKDGSARWMLLERPSETVLKRKGDWGFAAAPILVEGIAYAADLNGTVYAVRAY